MIYHLVVFLMNSPSHMLVLTLQGLYMLEMCMIVILKCIKPTQCCASSRNVHLELCSNMSFSCLIRSIKRFIAHRGKFVLAISDHFQTF